MVTEKPIKIAIHALGGQGGGVLANWLVTLGELTGYIAQSTSVPGVAQRTGTTVYYVELFPMRFADAKEKPPVLALMPAPGDVDIVIAAELMEAGRAILRGFVTEQTTLITSSHRIFSIDEKIHMGEGRRSVGSVISTANNIAGRFIMSDMEALATSTGAVISAVLFGALSGAGALPISRQHFEAAIRNSGRSVEQNLAGFHAGYEAAAAPVSTSPDVAQSHLDDCAEEAADAVKPILETLDDFPPSARFIMREGLKKIVDFQDVAYGHLYLDRLQHVYKLDAKHGGELRDWSLLKNTAKHLALWMAYDDVVRVADLKTRASRFQRTKNDTKIRDTQNFHVLEYMHPRVEEICDLLPVPLANLILKNAILCRVLKKTFGNGRRVSTTKLRGFLVLYFISLLRFMRRKSYRYGLEQARISDWLECIENVVKENYQLACDVARLQRLIKGYGDTHQRGMRKFNSIMSVFEVFHAEPDAVSVLDKLFDAALKDETGVALEAAFKKLELST